jgi:hypothetical protein
MRRLISGKCFAGFYGYGGEGFSLLLPSQWNPSKEREEPGVVLRYEDNGDSLNNVVVVARKADKSSIEGYGSPDEFLNKISPLLGEQVFSGESMQPSNTHALPIFTVWSSPWDWVIPHQCYLFVMPDQVLCMDRLGLPLRKSDKSSQVLLSGTFYLSKIDHGAGETRSEGGFAKNKVQSASLLDASVAKDKNGKSYYK